MTDRDPKSDEDTITEALEFYAEGDDAWSDVKAEYEENYRFARLSEQWPTDVERQRSDDGRPCMTINRLPSMIRQVVNDGRQNRPAIKVRPMNNGADVETAEVMAGLVRHIESISDADVAYDTALDNATSGGFGFVGVDVEYACDDSFDLELKITTKTNPLAITWDAKSTAADSSDWNYAFEIDPVPLEQFKAEYPKAQHDASDFATDSHITEWFQGEMVRVAKYYRREKTKRKILLMSDGSVLDADAYAKPDTKDLFDALGISVVRERTVESYKIIIRKITGLEVLEETTWAGDIIPLVPFYGETLNMEGERFFRALTHDAKDAQRIHNYSRSTATELVSLAPKVPFLGEAGVFDVDRDKWDNVNTKSWPFIEYKKGMQAPQRQEFAGVPSGAINEAAMALDDVKSIIGIHDASLGIPGNEISGKAIRYRQHEGDVSTFHFIDNQHRGVRCVGRILLNMIPQVYTPGRIVRILGEDGKPQHVQIGGQPKPMGQPPGMVP